MTSPHAFDEAIHLTPQSEGLWLGHTHPAYSNMVGPFGGITAATALAAVLNHPARIGDPIALTVNFASPVADGPFEVAATVMRTNRSTQHWGIQLRQDGAIVTTATAVLATRRETWTSSETDLPAAPSAASLERHTPFERVRWTSAYDMRFIQGAPPSLTASNSAPSSPDSASKNSTSLLWVRDEPVRCLDFCSLAAMCDMFFPRIFIKRASWTPIGTVSFTVYFHADAAMLASVGSQHVLAQARAQQFRNGFFDQSAELWGPTGELLALTHQMVYYKE